MPQLPQELVESVGELAGLLLSEQTIDTALDRVSTLSTAGIQHCDGAGVTLVGNGDASPSSKKDRAFTAAYSAPFVKDVDVDQYETREGPCLQALLDKRTYKIDSLGEDDRWPRFAERAIEKRICSCLSVPLIVADRSLGALNLYSHTAHAFDEHDVELSEAYAAQAAITLANVEVHESVVSLAEGLSRAMESRAVIEQAKGIIMLKKRCSAEEAFDILRVSSQNSNRKLRDIAQSVVDVVASAGDSSAKSPASEGRGIASWDLRGPS